MRLRQIVLLLLLALAVAAFVVLDLGRFLSFEQLKASQASFAQLHAAQPLTVAVVYFLIYVLATALSFPGASIITLAGGAVFGLWQGLLIVSFASTVGATLAFLASRFVLRDWVEARFGQRLADINAGVNREGAFYLFTLRLIPVVPFFLINLLMGLTRMKVWTFYWVSQIGMLAGTAVFVNAGTQLAQLESVKGILSPALLGSFVLLGIFPLVARRIVAVVQKRKVYARWADQRPKTFDRNLIVIGGGAGGLVSAYIAATVKAKVTLIEAHKMGGDCLNYGCVPSKALIKSAKIAHQMRHASDYGLSDAAPSFSFKAVMQRVHNVIAAIEPHDSIERYTGLGVEVLQGYGKLVNPWTVEVALNDGSTGPDGRPKLVRLTARSIVIAAGARPFVPPLPGLDDVGYVTSDTLWDEFAKLNEVPKRLVVLGGGPIGCELAQSFARLGAHVTQVEMGARLMVREDEEVSELAKASLQADGVQVLTAHKALRCEIRPAPTTASPVPVTVNPVPVTASPVPDTANPFPVTASEAKQSMDRHASLAMTDEVTTTTNEAISTTDEVTATTNEVTTTTNEAISTMNEATATTNDATATTNDATATTNGAVATTFEKYLIVEHNGQEKAIPFDQLLCAVGRVARLQAYGLEDLGIPTHRTIETNEYLQTIYPNIYAAGDVAGPFQFTHTAAHQAWYAAVNALFGEWKLFKADYSVIPWATFIDPEVARVGLNEQEAKEKNIPYEVTKYGIDDLDRAIADSEAHGFVKVLTVPGKDKILGVTIVGAHAADLLAEYVLAMKHGLGLNKILGTIHTYPTMSEANKYAAGEWKRAHAPQKLLAWVKKYHDYKRGA